MAQSNRVSFKMTPEDVARAKALIDQLKAILEPHLIALSPEERHDLPKMGEKTVSFVERGAEHCAQNPSLVPPYLDVEELQRDVEAVVVLRSLYNPLYQLTEGVGDTMTLTGSEGYSGVLVFYHSVRNAAKTKIQSAQAIYDDLQTRFPGRPKKVEENSGT